MNISYLPTGSPRSRWSIGVSLAFFCVQLNSTSTRAMEYYGRATLGTYVSVEQHTASLDGSTRNDFATGSARIYLRLNKIGSAGLEAVADLKEKYDLYEELDRVNQSLDAANELQFRQLYVADDKAFSYLYYKLGRFSVNSVGGAFVDGFELGFTLGHRGWKFGLLSGADPQTMGQSYLDFNSKAQIAGVYVDFQSNKSSWNDFLQANLGVVQKTYAGEVDRQFIYENILYQWARNSRIQALSYLDLVPRSNIQNLNLIYSHAITSDWDVDVRAIGIDVIEYRRKQDIRETLTPSPYQEVRAKVQNQFRPRMWVGMEGRSGTRSVDGLTLTSAEVFMRLPRLLSRRMDFSVSLGYQDRFGRKGLREEVSAGYFRDFWELTATLEHRTEEISTGETLNPLILEGTLGYNFSRDVFTALTFQAASDERVTIGSFFMKVGYRFGERLEAPLRDNAPIRGRL